MPSKPSRPPVDFTAFNIRFVGEQDGIPERELKARLIELLRGESIVERAYLARLDYGDDTGTHVALCVKCSPDAELLLNRPIDDIFSSVNQKIGGVFADIFRRDEHLDFMFLRDDQERELLLVCEPFFRADK